MKLSSLLILAFGSVLQIVPGSARAGANFDGSGLITRAVAEADGTVDTQNDGYQGGHTGTWGTTTQATAGNPLGNYAITGTTLAMQASQSATSVQGSASGIVETSLFGDSAAEGESQAQWIIHVTGCESLSGLVTLGATPGDVGFSSFEFFAIDELTLDNETIFRETQVPFGPPIPTFLTAQLSHGLYAFDAHAKMDAITGPGTFVTPDFSFSFSTQPCSSNLISQQPAGGTVAPGATMSLNVVAGGAANAATQRGPVGEADTGFTYQWRHGGQDLVDDGRISGATSSTLTIDDFGANDAGSYVVAVDDGTIRQYSSVVNVALPEPDPLLGLAVGAGALACFAGRTRRREREGAPVADSDREYGSSRLRFVPGGCWRRDESSMMRSHWRLAVFALLGSVLATHAVSADSSVFIYASVSQNYESAPIPPPVSRNVQDSGPGITRAADTVTLNSSGLSAGAAGSATAIATEGSLWIRAGGGALVKTGHYDTQGNPYMGSQGAWADAETRATWTDMVTISAPGHAGLRGSAVALLELAGGSGAGHAPFVNIRNPDGGFLFVDTRGYGRVTVSGNGISSPTQTWDDACVAVGWSGWLACANAVADDSSGTNSYAVGDVGSLPVVLEFTFGQPFSLTYTLYSNGGGYAATSYYKMAAFGEGTGDGLLTLDWGGITNVFDALGDPVVDYEASSDSGFDYRVPAPAPEPASGAMLLAGLVFLGRLGRRSAYHTTSSE